MVLFDNLIKTSREVAGRGNGNQSDKKLSQNSRISHVKQESFKSPNISHLEIGDLNKAIESLDDTNFR